MCGRVREDFSGAYMIRIFQLCLALLLLSVLFACRSPEFGDGYRYSPVSVIAIQPRPGAKRIPPLTVVSITFSRPISLHKDAFRVYYMGKGMRVVGGALYPSSDYRTYSFVPNHPYESGQYQCVLLPYPPLSLQGGQQMTWMLSVRKDGILSRLWSSSKDKVKEFLCDDELQPQLYFGPPPPQFKIPE